MMGCLSGIISCGQHCRRRPPGAHCLASRRASAPPCARACRPDGGCVALDTEELPAGVAPLPADAPVLILLPGLTGGSEDSYVQHAVVGGARQERVLRLGAAPGTAPCLQAAACGGAGAGGVFVCFPNTHGSRLHPSPCPTHPRSRCTRARRASARWCSTAAAPAHHPSPPPNSIQLASQKTRGEWAAAAACCAHLACLPLAAAPALLLGWPGRLARAERSQARRVRVPPRAHPTHVAPLPQQRGGSRAEPLPRQPALCGGVVARGQHPHTLPG